MLEKTTGKSPSFNKDKNFCKKQCSLFILQIFKYFPKTSVMEKIQDLKIVGFPLDLLLSARFEIGEKNVNIV